MRFTHPAGLPCYFVVKTPNKGAFYLCSLLFFLDLCKFLLTFSRSDKVRERAKLKHSVSRLVCILFPELEKLVPTLYMNSVYALLEEFF